MTKEYRVDFTYTEYRMGDVTLQANDVAEAKEFALDSIEMSYPEAEDIEIIKVTEING